MELTPIEIAIFQKKKKKIYPPYPETEGKCFLSLASLFKEIGFMIREKSVDIMDHFLLW
jgi:hypothetical protein